MRHNVAKKYVLHLWIQGEIRRIFVAGKISEPFCLIAGYRERRSRKKEVRLPFIPHIRRNPVFRIIRNQQMQRIGIFCYI